MDPKLNNLKYYMAANNNKNNNKICLFVFFD